MNKPSHQDTQKTRLPNKQNKISMHEDVPFWYDCCSCEAEPYWAKLAKEMEIDLSDREDVNTRLN